MLFSMPRYTETIFPVKKVVALSAEMAARIGDYRFAHRLQSENEAIRRLIEAGLKAGAPIPIRQPKPGDDGAGGGRERQRAAIPKAPKAEPERSAQPASSKPLSKEAQLRALRESHT